MAKKASVTLEVLLKSAGIKATTQQIDKLQKELKQLAGQSDQTTSKMVAGSKQRKEAAKREGEVYRNNRGVSEATGRGAKDFSRMQQGMGGLVQAYATVAANVYALSSAFLVLRRAADLSSMIKSSEDFSNRFGRSVTRITKAMQEATGGALTFAEALPTINKAISAGISTEKIEQLSVAATKAAQTFGGTANEALGRFISAAQRGRVEIIQTLGVVIQTEKAYETYAAAVGKAKNDLTAFDKQQAIINATIAESQNVFDGVTIDPNPFQQLLTTVVDLKDTISTFITDNFTPFINLFNKSKAAAAALIAVIVQAVAGRIFPALGDQIEKMQIKSIRSTARAKDAVTGANKAITRSILENGVKQNKLSQKDLLKRDQMFKTFYKDRLSKHKSFGKSLLNERKKLNAAVINEQRAAITRELNIRAGLTKGKPSETFKGISNEALENQRNRLILLTKELKNAKAAQEKLTAAEKAHLPWLRQQQIALKQNAISFRANSIAVRSEITTGFSKSFATMQTNMGLALKKMTLEYKRFARSVVADNATMAGSMQALGRAMGRTAGVIAGGITRLISAFSTITIIISVGAFIWEKWGDALQGITPEQRKLIEGLEAFKESLEENTERMDKYLVKIGEEAPENLRELKSALEFAGGSFTTVEDSVVQFQKSIKDALGGRTISEVRENIASIEDKIKSLQERSKLPGAEFAPIDYAGEITNLRKKLEEEVETLKTVANTSFSDLGSTLSKTLEVATKAGVQKDTLTKFLKDSFQKTITDSLPKELTSKQQTKLDELFEAMLVGDKDQIKLAETSFKLAFGNNAEAVDILSKALKNVGTVGGSNLLSLASAIGSVQEVTTNTVKYFDNYERKLIQSAQTFDKEYTTQVLNAKNALKELADAQQGNADLEKIAAETADFDTLRKLLGASADEAETVEQLLALAEDRLGGILKLGREKQLIDQKTKLTQELINATELSSVKNNDERIAKAKEILRLKKVEANLGVSDAQNAIDTLEQQIVLEEAKAADALETGKELSKAEKDKLADLRVQLILAQLGLDIAIERVNQTGEELKKSDKLQKSIVAIEAAERSRNRINNELALNKNQIITSNLEEIRQLENSNRLEREKINNEIDLLNKKKNNIKIDKDNADVAKQEIADLEEKIRLEQQRLNNLNLTTSKNLEILYITQEQNKLQSDLTIAQQAAKVASQQIARSDADRIDILKRQQQIQEIIAALELKILRTQAVQAVFNKDNVDQKRNIALAYAAQISASEELLAITKEINAANLAAAEPRNQQEVLRQQIEILGIQQDTAKILLQQNFSYENQLEVAKLNLRTLDSKYEKEKESLDLERQIIRLTKRNGDEQDRALALIDAKEKKLKAEYDLKREILVLDEKSQALSAGQKGLFTKESLDVFFGYFSIKARKAASEVEPIFKTLGDGFYDTVTNTFETAVNNLLEGGKDFAHTVREAFKAGLREMVSSAIMNDMIRIFGVIGESIKSQIEQVQKQREISKDNTLEEIKINIEKRGPDQQMDFNEAVQKILSEGKIESQEAAYRIIVYNLPKIYQSLQEFKNKEISVKADFSTLEGLQNQAKDQLILVNEKLLTLNESTNTITQANQTINAHLETISSTLFEILLKECCKPTGEAGVVSNLLTSTTKAEPTGIISQNTTSSPSAMFNMPNAATPDFSSLEAAMKKIGQTPVTLAEGQKLDSIENSPGIEGKQDMTAQLITAATKDSKEGIIGVLQSLISVMSTMSSMGGGEGGSFWSTAINAVVSAFAGGAANGGIVPGGIKAFANGGMVKEPTFGLIGEGSRNEAVVPLPNNREIPVDMKGSSGDTINIEQNFDFRNADSGSVAALRTEAKMIEERTFNRVFSEISKGGRYAKIVGRR